jgi:hypothetical protein
VVEADRADEAVRIRLLQLPLPIGPFPPEQCDSLDIAEVEVEDRDNSLSERPVKPE